MAITRRKLLSEGAKWGVGASLLATQRRSAQANGGRPPLFVVFAGLGGYSIQDAFMAIRASEAGSQADVVNTFPDAWVEEVGPFRAVAIPPDLPEGAAGRPSFQAEFLRRHAGEMLVFTHLASSVNHPVAQQRVLNGDRVFYGRTIMEAAAAHYGQSMPLANVNMALSGFAEHGYDRSLPSWARAVSVSDPWMFPLALSGHEGLSRPWSKGELDLMRGMREQVVEARSAFVRDNGERDFMRIWSEHRSRSQLLESASAVRSLNLNPSTDERPFDQYGLPQSPDLPRLQAVFTRLDEDPFEAQAALSFLLLKNGLSVSVALGPAPQALELDGRPINVSSAFDASHGVHRPNQAIMWNRYLEVADKLITLLKDEPDVGGGTLWDRTVFYMPSEFGRYPGRPSGQTLYGTDHDLEGAGIVISPLANGGRILGDIDRSSGRLWGFQPEDPNSQPDRTKAGLTEEQTYAGILHMLRVPSDGSGLEDVRALRNFT